MLMSRCADESFKRENLLLKSDIVDLLRSLRIGIERRLRFLTQGDITHSKRELCRNLSNGHCSRPKHDHSSRHIYVNEHQGEYIVVIDKGVTSALKR